MKIGNKVFDFTKDHTYVMGILNVTPDSFSDGGKFNEKDKALYHVEQMINEGADIIDVGGESTRPGYQKISIEEEIARVTGMLEAIKARFDIPVSIDTYKAPVMKEALKPEQIWQMISGDCVTIIFMQKKVKLRYGIAKRWQK